METAKVDIRKLEILSERVNQVLDALHQVRLSVHGYQPFSQVGGSPTTQYGYPTWGQPYGYGVSPLAAQQLLSQQGISPFGPLAAQSPYSPFGQPFAGVNPFNTIGSIYAQQGVPGMFPVRIGGGADIAETDWSRANDPMRMTRIAQTFPNFSVAG